MKPFCRDNLKFIEELEKCNFSTSDYCLINSAWLAMLGIRKNNDLDILITKAKRNSLLNGKDGSVLGLPGKFENRIRIHPSISVYSKYCHKLDADEIIRSHSVTIDGINLIHPTYYFMYKRDRFSSIVQTLNKLSWLRKKLKFFLASKGQKKAFNKFHKDSKDFEELSLFFTNKDLSSPPYNLLSKDQWGLSIIENYINNRNTKAN